MRGKDIRKRLATSMHLTSSVEQSVNGSDQESVVAKSASKSITSSFVATGAVGTEAHAAIARKAVSDNSRVNRLDIRAG